MDNHAALTYLVKMERTRNLLMIQEATEIWEFCLANQIPLTAEYLPGLKNTRKDKASKNLSSKWPLNKPMFQKLIQGFRTSGYGSGCIQVVPPDPNGT